ncbi:LysR family transcriptional regulator [Rothia sp. ZJ932]|uniref:LysR family transcriptional regulator n=1 Tax=Rothia sp. ZJ932 TaxID=2810516 RepID=UPI00196700C9|nr:LysR family transcriptional regulator [Rothia sp. ZJ932]QRZ60960.1 LysR family transcriptional regulator [Rothia sp. ZJ932]
MYDVRRLNMLLEVHERGTLAAAAQTLHLTPSAISQQLSALEKEVGTPLLTHVRRRYQLTEAGRILIEGTRSVLSELDTMKTRIERLTGEPSGTVRIAIFQSAALAVLPKALEYLAQHAPQVALHAVQIEPEIGLTMTKSREFDITIAEAYPHHFIPEMSELSYDLLTHDPLHLMVPTSSAVEHVADTHALPWVLERPGNTSREWAINRCRSFGFDPTIRYEIDDVITHVHLVKAGLAAAMVPHFIVQAIDSLDGVRLIDHEEQSRKIFVVTRTESRDQLSITAVREALQHAVNH